MKNAVAKDKQHFISEKQQLVKKIIEEKLKAKMKLKAQMESKKE